MLSLSGDTILVTDVLRISEQVFCKIIIRRVFPTGVLMSETLLLMLSCVTRIVLLSLHSGCEGCFDGVKKSIMKSGDKVLQRIAEFFLLFFRGLFSWRAWWWMNSLKRSCGRNKDRKSGLRNQNLNSLIPTSVVQATYNASNLLILRMHGLNAFLRLLRVEALSETRLRVL